MSKEFRTLILEAKGGRLNPKPRRGEGVHSVTRADLRGRTGEYQLSAFGKSKLPKSAKMQKRRLGQAKLRQTGIFPSRGYSA